MYFHCMLPLFQNVCLRLWYRLVLVPGDLGLMCQGVLQYLGHSPRWQATFSMSWGLVPKMESAGSAGQPRGTGT